MCNAQGRLHNYIAVHNITGKLILTGNIDDQVDSPGQLTENKELARKKDKVCAYFLNKCLEEKK